MRTVSEAAQSIVKVVTDNRNHNGKILLRVTPLNYLKVNTFIKNELVQQYTALTRSFLYYFLYILIFIS